MCTRDGADGVKYKKKRKFQTHQNEAGARGDGGGTWHVIKPGNVFHGQTAALVDVRTCRPDGEFEG